MPRAVHSSHKRKKLPSDEALQALRAELASLLDAFPQEETPPELRVFEQILEQLERSRLLPVTLDYVFKRVFEDDLDVLASLLNAILKREGAQALTGASLQVVNPIQHRRSLLDKSVTLDILVQSSEKESFDVEMQVVSRPDMRERALYYGARLLIEQIKKGQLYHELRPVKVIFFAAFELFKEHDEVHSIFQLREQARHSLLNGLLELHFLELPKLLRASARVDMRERMWLQYLSGPSPKELKELLMREPMIAKAYARQQEISQETKEWVESLGRLRNYMDFTVYQERAELLQKETEALRKQAELVRQEADLRRLEAERSREEAERSKEVAEASRLEAERSKEVAEASRLEAERSKEVAEASRLEAERSKEVAEARRLEAERSREEAERNRKEAERNRLEAERNRQALENVRQEAEASLKSIQDSARLQAETLKAQELALQQEREARAREQEAYRQAQDADGQRLQRLIASTTLLLQQRFGSLPASWATAMQQPGIAERLPELLPALLSAPDLPSVEQLLNVSSY